MELLTTNLSALFFIILLMVGALYRRKVQKRVLEPKYVVGLIWLSVGVALTLIYTLGSIDFFFNNANMMSFKTNDLKVIALAGSITLSYLAIDRFIAFLKQKGKKSP